MLRGKAEGEVSFVNPWKFLPCGGRSAETGQHDDGWDGWRVAGEHVQGGE